MANKEWKVLARKRYKLKTLLFQTQKHCAFCFALLWLTKKAGKRRCGKAGARFRALQVQATLEHIIPVSRKGTDDLWNLTLSCHGCNQKRGTTGFIEFVHSPYVQRKRGFVLRAREFRFHSRRLWSKSGRFSYKPLEGSLVNGFREPLDNSTATG